MDLKELKAKLLELIHEKALQTGDVTLASGQKADFYIDGKQITLDAEGVFVLSKTILAMLHGVEVHAIGGPTLGADPIAAGVALLSYGAGNPIRAFIVRKDSKKHGMQKMIEGPELQAGDKVVMVEDVITTGGSVLKAIEAVEAVGAKVVKTICIVDRDQGASELLEKYGYTPIFELRELNVGK